MSKDAVIRKMLKALEKGARMAKKNLDCYCVDDLRHIAQEQRAYDEMQAAIEAGRAATAG